MGPDRSTHHVQLPVGGGKVDGCSRAVVLGDEVGIGLHDFRQLLWITHAHRRVEVDRQVARTGRKPAGAGSGAVDGHPLAFLAQKGLEWLQGCGMTAGKRTGRWPSCLGASLLLTGCSWPSATLCQSNSLVSGSWRLTTRRGMLTTFLPQHAVRDAAAAAAAAHGSLQRVFKC